MGIKSLDSGSMSRRHDDLADALSNITTGSPARGPGSSSRSSSSSSTSSRSSSGDALPPMMSPTPVRRAPVVERSGMSSVRATIPTCLVLMVLLPVFAVYWRMLPPADPLKVGGHEVPYFLIGGGALFAVLAAVLMFQVGRHYER